MALVVGAVLLLSASLPPEHGHTDALGRTTVVHRHASLHILKRAQHVGLSGVDPMVMRIDNDYLVSSGPKVGRADAAEPAARQDVTARAATSVRARLDTSDAEIHGPPRSPSALRAPPNSLPS